jgi:prepilin-type N-terminal cleavage/methylation domain-containing protein
MRAFTLIELLLVVAIIALLVAIAVPNYLEATRRADTAACKSNLRTLGTALAMYRLDHGIFPPADGTAGPDPSPDHTTPGSGPAAGGSWDGVPRSLVSQRYITTETALFCPAMVRRYGDRKEYVRYAYNSSAIDTFWTLGGADDIERDRGDLWLARCVWVPAEMSFHPESGIVYPHGDIVDNGEKRSHVLENALFMSQRVETRNGREDFYEAFGIPYPSAK